MSSNINDNDSLATANLLASSGDDNGGTGVPGEVVAEGVPVEVVAEDDGIPGDLQLHAEDDSWIDPERRSAFFSHGRVECGRIQQRGS